MANILNKSLIGISFANNPELNIVFSDLHENGITISYNGDSSVNEISGFSETILSPNFYTRATITINLSPLSTKFDIWKNKVIENGYIEGSASIITDNGATFNIKKIFIKQGDIDANGTSGIVPFIITCDYEVNKELKS